MKKVLVFGTFDFFHKGHENFLRQAKKHGDYLVVSIARDVIVKKVKNKSPVHDEKQRLQAVINSGLADEVILGDLEDMYRNVREQRPQVICLGYDQNAFVNQLGEKLKEFGLEDSMVIRLEAYKPEIYKSSLIGKSQALMFVIL